MVKRIYASGDCKVDISQYKDIVDGYSIVKAKFFTTAINVGVVKENIEDYTVNLEWDELRPLGKGMLQFVLYYANSDSAFDDGSYDQTDVKTTDFYVVSDITVEDNTATDVDVVMAEEIQENLNEVNAKVANVYTKDETYSKDEVDELIEGGGGFVPSDYYDKEDIDGIVSGINEDFENYYDKDETYSKDEVDDLIEGNKLYISYEERQNLTDIQKVTALNNIHGESQHSSKNIKFLEPSEPNIYNIGVGELPNSVTDTVYIVKYNHTLSENVKIGSNCILRFDGGSINIPSGITLDLNGAIIEADNYQIFSGDGTIINTVIGHNNIVDYQEGKPEWFGATIGSDDTIAIQKCVSLFKTTSLSSAKYNITTVNVVEIANTLGRFVRISDSTQVDVKTGGEGFVIDAHCGIEGGRIHVEANATGITLRKIFEPSTTRFSDLRRAYIRNILMIGEKSVGSTIRNTYGINCVAKANYTYNTFCHISGIRFFGFEYAFYGNIRTSYIEVTIEGSHKCFTLTNGELNNIIINGNAAIINDIASIEQGGDNYDRYLSYQAFIEINGNHNSINSHVYDVGNTKNEEIWHRKLTDLKGVNNKIYGHISEHVGNSDTSNTVYKPYYADGFMYVKNPAFTTVKSNGFPNFANMDYIFDDRRLPERFVHTNGGATEEYVEFIFEQVWGFVGVQFFFSHANATFSRIEVYRDNSTSPLLTVKHLGDWSDTMEVYSTNYYNFYRPTVDFVPQVSTIRIRCVVEAGKRFDLLGAKFFAWRAPQKSKKSILGAIPSVRRLEGDTNFFTDKNVLGVYDGSNWLDAFGNPINANYVSPINGEYNIIKDTDFTAQFDRYYILDGTGIINITLPEVTINPASTKSIVFFKSALVSVDFVKQKNLIYFEENYSLITNNAYIIRAEYSQAGWVIKAMKIVLNENKIDFLMTTETNPEVLTLMHERNVCANSDYMLYHEAAAVTDPAKVNFQGNTTIIHFDELQYFTGITVINSASFQNCSMLKRLTLPSTIKDIYGTSTFYGTHFDSLTLLSEKVPSLDSGGSGLHSYNYPIYVPSGSVDAYKAATGWKTVASRIQAIPTN